MTMDEKYEIHTGQTFTLTVPIDLAMAVGQGLTGVATRWATGGDPAMCERIRGVADQALKVAFARVPKTP